MDEATVEATGAEQEQQTPDQTAEQTTEEQAPPPETGDAALDKAKEVLERASARDTEATDGTPGDDTVPPDADDTDAKGEDDIPPAAQDDADAVDAADAALLEQAAQFGYTEDDINSLGADRVQAIIGRHFADVGSRQTPAAEPPAQQPAPPPQEEPAAEPAPAADSGDPLDDVDMEDVDPDVLGVLKKLVARDDARAKELKELRAERTAQQAATQRSAQADANTARIESFDQFLGGLGDDFQEAFGTGTQTDLLTFDAHGKCVPVAGAETHVKNRSELFDLADTIRRGMQAKGVTPDAAAVFRMALSASDFATDPKTTARQELHSKTKQRRRTMTAKPTHRNGPELSPQEKQQAAEDAAGQRAAAKNRASGATT